MKNFSKLCLTLLLLVFVNNTQAQDKNNPWAVSFGINAVDLYPVGEDAPLGSYFDEYFNVNDHWNILPSLSTVSVSRYLSDNFSFGVTGSINRIEKAGDAPASDLTYFGVDGIIKYSLGDIISSKLEPHLGIGGGYTWIDDIGAGTVNGSLGLTYWFTDNVGFGVQSTYKHAFEDYLAKHFQHAANVTIRFGGTDTDGDGIFDKDDACPEVAGLEAFNGCPDSDGDGIQDDKDDCPNDAGSPEHNGCPDSDGDGVINKNDDCPQVAGLKSLRGCPDSDGDGIKNSADNCPNEAGPSANNGCPWKDTDGDGILDKDDNCVDKVGTVANNGCPEELSVADEETLRSYASTILFETNSADFKNSTYSILDSVVSILKKYPTSNFAIHGYTDSSGSASYNQKLSEKRASAVKNYLTQNGIEGNRLSSAGFGEDNPIASNRTRDGRAQNRRVEIKLVK